MKIYLNQPYSFCQLGKRGKQEDARYPDMDKPAKSQPFYVVCDGVGGCDNGEMASRTVCDALGKCLKHTDWTQTFEVADFGKALDDAYSALYKAADKHSRDMATTLTFIGFHCGGVLVAHIGDSRIYHIRPGVGILYRSDDHSLVNALVHSGNLTPDEAENHPQSNYITRCMGWVKEDEERALATVLQIADIESGDYFILCTDGVLHSTTDEMLMEIVSQDIPDEEKCMKLATICKDSSDNNTACILPVGKVFREEESTSSLEMTNDNETVPLRSQNVVVEVMSQNTLSLKNKVSRFFKKLFQ